MEQSEELIKSALKIYKSHFGNDPNNQYIKSVCNVLTTVYSKIETQNSVDNSLSIDDDDDADPNTEDERDVDRRTEGEFSSSSGNGNSPNESERSTPPTDYAMNQRAQSNESEQHIIPNDSGVDSCQTESEKRASTLISGSGCEQGSAPITAEKRVNSSMCIPKPADSENNDHNNYDLLEQDEKIERKRSKQSVRSHGSKSSKKMKELEEEEEAVRMIHASSLSDMKILKKGSKEELFNQPPRPISSSVGTSHFKTPLRGRKRTKSSRSLTLESTVIPVSNSKFTEDDKKKYCCTNSTCNIL